MVTNNNGVVATNDLRATSYWWVSTIRRSASFNYISFNSFVIFIFFVFLYSIQFMLVYMESMRGVLYLILNLNRDKKKSSKIYVDGSPKAWDCSLASYCPTSQGYIISIHVCIGCHAKLTS